MPHRGESHAARRPGPVTVRAYGHRHVRATHHKTLELTRDEEITGRATCVIGVAAEEFPAALGLLRGPVRITVAAGGATLVGHATINPDHDVTRRLVIRRSDQTDPETLAIRADFAADTLSPDLVAALGRTGAPVTTTVEEIGRPQPLVILCRSGQPEPVGRAGVLWRYADATVTFDDASRRRHDDAQAALDVLSAGGTVAASLVAPLDRPREAAMSFLTAATRQHGARILAPFTPDSADAALLAAGLAPAPSIRLGHVDRRSVRRPEIAALSRQESVPVVLTVPTADSAAVLAPLAASAGSRAVAMTNGVVDVGVGMRWTTVAGAAAMDPSAADDGEEVTLILAAAEEEAGLPADLRALIEALLAAGVPGRAVSEAFKPWGVRRDDIYTLRRPDVPGTVSRTGRLGHRGELR